MTQTQRILAYLREHPEGITQMDAYHLGMGTRLAARISDARELLAPKERIVAVDEKHPGGSHARYVLYDETDTRAFRTLDDWERYRDSPHARHGHPVPAVGCEWCVRGAATDAVFTNAGEPAVVEDNPEPSLWDCGDAA